MAKQELLNKIKPKINKESDKYSWQLYQFIKKHGHTNVYLNVNDYNSGSLNKSHIRDVHIGTTYRHDDSVIGNSLSRILSPDRDKYSTYCYLNKRLGWNLVDITDEFWTQYIEIGRCAFDESHSNWLFSDNSRYEMIDENTKRCVWCGKILKKEIKVIEMKKEVWR